MLLFDTLPSGHMLLQPEPAKCIKRLKSGGFELDITELLTQFLAKPEVNYSRTFQFVVFKNRDVVIKNNCEMDIIPTCLVNGKAMSFIHSFVYDIDASCYKVRYFDNYMRS